MTRKEVSGRITDYNESSFSSSEAQAPQAHLATCENTHTHFGQSPQLTATPSKLPEPSPLPAKGKAKPLAAFREQPSRKSRFMLGGPREIAAVIVRIAFLVGIIWFAIAWTGIAIPTQKYKDYAIDFSKQILLPGGSHLAPAAIPRARLHLVIHLGLGSQPGPYEVVLAQDGVRYAAALGATKLEHQEPILRVTLDLSQAPLGESTLGIQPAGREGRYYKVILE